ncbi:MAG: tetratricopeptide repeat protein, partial [Candidatus Eiseniibacteriota bacterium]
CVGLVVAWKRAPLLGWIVVVYGLANVAFFITARYRAPMIPYLAIFAAAGVLWFLTQARRPARAVAFAGVAGVYALSNLGAGPMPARMNPDAELTLAGFLNMEGKLDQARDHYTLSIQGAPDDPEPWADLGALEMDSGHFVAAETAFQRALSIQPEYGGALLGLGALREQDGRIPEAIALYERAALADPKNPWPRSRIQALTRGAAPPR